MEYKLECRYDSRKSFYGKAKVEENDLMIYGKRELDRRLFSYGTLVARYYKFGNEIKYYYFGKYSQTTTRHQKEFFKQNGLNDKEIKILFENGVLIKNEEE